MKEDWRQRLIAAAYFVGYLAVCVCTALLALYLVKHPEVLRSIPWVK